MAKRKRETSRVEIRVQQLPTEEVWDFSAEELAMCGAVVKCDTSRLELDRSRAIQFRLVVVHDSIRSTSAFSWLPLLATPLKFPVSAQWKSDYELQCFTLDLSSHPVIREMAGLKSGLTEQSRIDSSRFADWHDTEAKKQLLLKLLERLPLQEAFDCFQSLLPSYSHQLLEKSLQQQDRRKYKYIIDLLQRWKAEQVVTPDTLYITVDNLGEQDLLEIAKTCRNRPKYLMGEIVARGHALKQLKALKPVECHWPSYLKMHQLGCTQTCNFCIRLYELVVEQGFRGFVKLPLGQLNLLQLHMTKIQEVLANFPDVADQWRS